MIYQYTDDIPLYTADIALYILMIYQCTDDIPLYTADIAIYILMIYLYIYG